MHTYLPETGSTSSSADPYVYNLGADFRIHHGDDIFLFGSDNERVLQVMKTLKGRFEAADLGDAKFLLGMRITSKKHAARNPSFVARNVRENDIGKVRTGHPPPIGNA